MQRRGEALFPVDVQVIFDDGSRGSRALGRPGAVEAVHLGPDGGGRVRRSRSRQRAAARHRSHEQQPHARAADGQGRTPVDRRAGSSGCRTWCRPMRSSSESARAFRRGWSRVLLAPEAILGVWLASGARRAAGRDPDARRHQHPAGQQPDRLEGRSRLRLRLVGGVRGPGARRREDARAGRHRRRGASLELVIADGRQRHPAIAARAGRLRPGGVAVPERRPDRSLRARPAHRHAGVLRHVRALLLPIPAAGTADRRGVLRPHRDGFTRCSSRSCSRGSRTRRRPSELRSRGASRST